VLIASDGRNLLDESKLIRNADVNITTGLQTTGARTIITDFISVQPSTQYTIKDQSLVVVLFLEDITVVLHIWVVALLLQHEH
jgi:hypothetical protein